MAKKYLPFIKWVGGKRGLISQIVPKLNKIEFNNYFEPFLGGGAIFFELLSRGVLKDKKVYLSDINFELINSYQVVRDNPNDLISNLETFQKLHSKDFFYEIRAWDREESFQNRDKIERASRFIYLNKTCFNGLYRVNKKGFFNTPIGSYKNPNIADRDRIFESSEALQNVEIEISDFKSALSKVEKDDLVYLDPPYYPLNITSNFTAYSEFEFLEDMQKELFAEFKRLIEIEAIPFQSNSNADFIRELYSKYKIDQISANRFINSKKDGRGKIDEVLISYKGEN
jgi:DNA adenine methylase